MPALVALLAKVSGLRVVLDHLGKPPVSGDADGWERDLCDLAALPRVSVKLSGVAPEASPRGGTIRRQALPWLAVALDAFGAERCMVGSDWPVSAVSVGREAPGRWLAHVLDDVGASVSERDDLAWRTAAAFYQAGISA